MSPEPEVRSHRLPIRSVRRRGVVPWLDIWPFKSAFLGRCCLDGAGQRIAGKRGKIVVRQILQLQLIGLALQAAGAGAHDRSASSQILPTGSLKAPSPYTMTSICCPWRCAGSVQARPQSCGQSRGNSFTLSSVALFEPSRPNCSLYPLPFTGAVIRSLSSSTFSAPAASRRRLERSRVWMSQHSTFFVYGSRRRTSFPEQGIPARSPPHGTGLRNTPHNPRR